MAEKMVIVQERPLDGRPYIPVYIDGLDVSSGAELTELETKITQLETDLGDLGTTVQTNESNLQSLQTTLTELTERVSALEGGQTQEE